MNIHTQQINSDVFKSKKINLFIKRIDLIHPFVSGNKYYKLVFDSYGIEIKCTGDYNAWSMKGTLVDWFEEGIKKVRSAA